MKKVKIATYRNVEFSSHVWDILHALGYTMFSSKDTVVKECSGFFIEEDQYLTYSSADDTFYENTPHYSEIRLEELGGVEIFGYIFRSEELLKVGSIITGVSLKAFEDNMLFEPKYHFSPDSFVYGDLLNKKLLDTLCFPIYECVTPKISINGYDMEVREENVKFGCKSFSKQFIRELNNQMDQNKVIKITFEGGDGITYSVTPEIIRRISSL